MGTISFKTNLLQCWWSVCFGFFRGQKFRWRTSSGRTLCFWMRPDPLSTWRSIRILSSLMKQVSLMLLLSVSKRKKNSALGLSEQRFTVLLHSHKRDESKSSSTSKCSRMNQSDLFSCSACCHPLKHLGGFRFHMLVKTWLLCSLTGEQEREENKGEKTKQKHLTGLSLEELCHLEIEMNKYWTNRKPVSLAKQNMLKTYF